MLAPGPKKLFSLIFVREGGRVLLGMKKRGFGTGKWNGFGGKVEPGESLEEAALRELREESSLAADALTYRGVNTFIFAGDPTELEVHIFEATKWTGEPEESDEMRPEWFREEDIPYDDMWADDRHWLPHFLEGKSFTGVFHFDGETLVRHRLDVG